MKADEIATFGFADIALWNNQDALKFGWKIKKTYTCKWNKNNEKWENTNQVRI